MRTKLDVMMQRSLSFLVLLWGSVPFAPAAGLEQCEVLTDVLSLLQQHTTATAILHTPSSSMPLTWRSNASFVASFKDFKKEVEAHSVEDAMRLYDSAQHLASMSHASLEDKGFMLLQEAGRIFGNPGKVAVLDSVREKLREKLTQVEQSSGKSQVFSCYSSIASLPVNLVGALFSIFVAVKCDSAGICTSDGLESLRYLLVSLSHLTGNQSYCADKIQQDVLCKASLYELGANSAGLSSNIAGAVANCPQYSGGAGKKAAGMKVASIRCSLGYAKGSTYLGLAIAKMAEIFILWGESAASKGDLHTTFMAVPPLAFSAQVGAAMAWIVQLVLLMSGGCKEAPGDIACAGEIVEVIAFIAQAVTSGLMANSYCFTPDNLKPAGREQSAEAAVASPLLEDVNLDESGSVDNGAIEKNPLKPKTNVPTDNTKPKRSVSVDKKRPKTSESSDQLDEILLLPDDFLGSNINIKINEERDGPVGIMAKIVAQVGKAVARTATEIFTPDKDMLNGNARDDGH